MKELKNRLLLSVDRSEVSAEHQEYFDITKAFLQLFISNLENVGARTVKLRKAKYGGWVTPVRLMMEQDEVTKEELKEVFAFLKNHHFWAKNILSTDKLRKQFDTLYAQLKTNERKQTSSNGTKTSYTESYLQDLSSRLQS